MIVIIHWEQIVQKHISYYFITLLYLYYFTAYGNIIFLIFLLKLLKSTIRQNAYTILASFMARKSLQVYSSNSLGMVRQLVQLQCKFRLNKCSYFESKNVIIKIWSNYLAQCTVVLLLFQRTLPLQFSFFYLKFIYLCAYS